MNYREIRKVQGIVGEHSYSLILPKNYVTEIGITKGDYLQVSKVENKLVIEKVVEGSKD